MPTHGGAGMDRTRRRVLLFVTAALAAVTAAVPAGAAVIPRPAQVALSTTFTSSDIGFAEGGTPADLPQWLDAMDAYVGDLKPIIRLDLDWWYVQPQQCDTCPLHWDHLDPLVDAANARGMRVLIVLAYSPPWA